jgi:Domain of unknown function (DUF1844)
MSDEKIGSDKEKAKASQEAYDEAAEMCGVTDDERRLPPIDLSTFVLSLSQAALLHLGEIDNPETGKREVNFPLARQSIDLLTMLQDKTRGNLTEEELKLLENLLYDLRMKYVAECKGS